jgi:F-type H+-transporting ATPase subunit epsilon
MALHLEIVTPKGSVIDVEAEEVILPGKLGEFGVLGGHIPFLSAMKPGVVSYKDNGTPKRLAVGTGFAEVGAGDRVLVLTDACAQPDEVDVGQTEQELQDAEAELKEWEGELSVEHQELLDRAEWAQARLDLRDKGN